MFLPHQGRVRAVGGWRDGFVRQHLADAWMAVEEEHRVDLIYRATEKGIGPVGIQLRGEEEEMGTTLVRN
jgi:hypothetical protein